MHNPKQVRSLPSAFTLVELLIVVTIIATLAAIAVPNFLNAQIRSKVSRVKADHRTLATALEIYFVDYGTYPPNNNGVSNSDPSSPARSEFILPVLSTPNSYVSLGLLIDPFLNAGAPRIAGDPDILPDYTYFNGSSADILGNLIISSALGLGVTARTFKANQWWLISAGPDRTPRVAQISAFLGDDPYVPPASSFSLWVSELNADPFAYDPSNGTISQGDIIRTSKGIFEPSAVGL